MEEKAEYKPKATTVDDNDNAQQQQEAVEQDKPKYDYIMLTSLEVIAAALFVQELPEKYRQMLLDDDDTEGVALFKALDASKLHVAGGRVVLLVPADIGGFGDLKTSAYNNRFLRAVMSAQQQISHSMAAASAQRKQMRQ